LIEPLIVPVYGTEISSQDQLSKNARPTMIVIVRDFCNGVVTENICTLGAKDSDIVNLAALAAYNLGT
jgi:hypothetical protein